MLKYHCDSKDCSFIHEDGEQFRSFVFGHREFDLCLSCAAKFNTWIKEYLEPRELSFKVPELLNPIKLGASSSTVINITTKDLGYSGISLSYDKYNFSGVTLSGMMPADFNPYETG